MTDLGCSLVNKQSRHILASYPAGPPARIDVPPVRVDGAQVGWEDPPHALVPRVLDLATPPPTEAHTVTGEAERYDKDAKEVIVSRFYGAPPPAARAKVLKSTIVKRLAEYPGGQRLTHARQRLNQDAYAAERWAATDKPAVYADDATTIQILNAAGADPAIVLADDPAALGL